MGKSQRDKGNRVERLLVNMFRGWGLKALRVPLSGATEYAKGDVDVYPPGRDAPLIGEVKSRKKIPGWIKEWLGENDYLALKGDREEFLFVVPEATMCELLGGDNEPGEAG